MNKFIFILLFMPVVLLTTSGHAQTINLKGTVRNIDTKEQLSGAFVTCTNAAGVSLNAITDEDGEFKFKNIAAGEYDLKIEYIGFTTYTSRLNLAADHTGSLTIQLARDNHALTGVNVFGKLSQEDDAGARQKEQRAATILNIISAKAMERSPDINAANVLQRMSGLTIQRNGGGDEAYPIVRGLDPRYSNTLINGIKITSPDDKSRYVPLNIVPSDLLGSIEVSKSLLPEMEGDAIGGFRQHGDEGCPRKRGL